jgi:lipopolysaccharide transport system permease protein
MHNASTASLSQHYPLIRRLLSREISSRYRGFIIGKLWFVMTPLLMLAIFTFVFSQVFAVRWDNVVDPRQLALMLFAGLVIYQFFAELLVRAPGLILEEKAYVNKSVFPLYVLPLVATLSALANMAISFLLLVLLHLMLIGTMPLTALWLPVVIAPLVILTLGVVFMVSATGVYLRDLKQVTPWLGQVAMFLGPVFYPVTSLPPWARDWINLNPISVIIENARATVLFARAPDFIQLWVYTIVAFALLVIGIRMFMRLKPGFADVV